MKNKPIPHTRNNSKIPHTRNNSKIPHTRNNSKIPHIRNNSKIPHIRNNSKIPHTRNNSKIPHIRNNSNIKYQNRRNRPNRYTSTHIHHRSLSWLCKGTSIKKWRVKSVLWAQPCPLTGMMYSFATLVRLSLLLWSK